MSRSVEHLLRVVARRCGPGVSVVTGDAGGWGGTVAELIPPAELAGGPETGNLLLELDGDAVGFDLVDAAWERLAPGAWLVLLAPNPAAGAGAVDAKQLRRALLAHGRVRRWKDQPYRWLAYACMKRGDEFADVKPDERARYEVTAGLCSGRVLELGCGRGDLSGFLSERGHEVTACDLAADKVALAASRHPQVEFIVSDIFELAQEEQAFDTVLLPEVLEHVDEASGARLLEKAWSFVAPGGRLVVTVPNEACIPHENHLVEFDRAGLAAALRPFGEAEFCLDQPYKWLIASVRRG